jgi:DNA-binding HxlR family transcriptional regulator
MLSGDRLQKKITPFAAKFQAVGNVHRLSILYLLIREPLTLPVLSRRLKRSPSLIFHHLKDLERNGWITKTKFGKIVTYYAQENAVKVALSILRK